MPEAQSPDIQPAPPGAGRSIRFYLFGTVVVVGAGLAVGYFHISRNNDVAVAREARASVVDRGPRVEVVAATQGPQKRTITLLADVRSNAVATLYGKVSGYMKTVNVDQRRQGRGRAGRRPDRVAGSRSAIRGCGDRSRTQAAQS